jgi:transcriptional regulator with XRE-family HTH domain
MSSDISLKSSNIILIFKQRYRIIKAEELRRLLAANIRTQRAILGISQEKLAEQAGISTQMVNYIEGCRTWVSDKTLARIAEVLKVDIFQLLLPPDVKLLGAQVLSQRPLSRLRQAIKADIDARFDQMLR